VSKQVCVGLADGFGELEGVADFVGELDAVEEVVGERV